MPNIIKIHDSVSKTEASIHLDRGCNCFSFKVPDDGKLHEVLWAAPEFVDGAGRPSGSGIPILFPFPGRINDGAFSWDGKDYQLDKNGKFGNAIHGFVYERAWREVARTDNRFEAVFRASVDDPQLATKWPADFEIHASFQVSDCKLEINFRISNPSSIELPFGLGLHPYFRIPLLDQASNDQTMVTMPLASQWELDDMIPNGQTKEVPAYKSEQPFNQLKLDDVFSNQQTVAEHFEFEIRQADTNRRLKLTCEKNFPYTVAFTPPHGEAICIEPYTCVPDGINLHASGTESGWIVLKPGETFDTSMSIQVK